MSHRPRLRTLGRRSFVAALALTATVPAAAEAASAWQFSDFRLAGGTRFTLTLSKQQQLPGVDPAIWPKGYRYVCSITGPKLRLKVNRWSMNDTAELTTNVGYAKAGALVYTRLGSSPNWSLFTTAADHAPRTVETTPLANLAVRPNPAKAPVAPALGLYNLQLVPQSEWGVSPFSLLLPAATIAAKLDVRQGTEAECPTPTDVPWEYYRASR